MGKVLNNNYCWWMRDFTCLEALACRAFDLLNCQILTQMFLKSNAQGEGVMDGFRIDWYIKASFGVYRVGPEQSMNWMINDNQYQLINY